MSRRLTLVLTIAMGAVAGCGGGSSSPSSASSSGSGFAGTALTPVKDAAPTSTGKLLTIYGPSFRPAQIVHDVPALVERP